MSIPRVRSTVRRLMLAVAVAALVLWGFLWGLDLARLSGEYRKKAVEAEETERVLRSLEEDYPEKAAKYGDARRYFASVKEKYRRAVLCPWLPLPRNPADPDVYRTHGPPSAFSSRRSE